MNGAAWANQYRTTMVCIDHYENGILRGCMQNPYRSETFHSTIDFLKKTESMLDEMNFPQSASVSRVFSSSPKSEPSGLGECTQRSGTLATFSLRILFRQNASWQGSVTWVEGKQEESFRSVLELLFLMDSALCASQEKTGGSAE